MAFILTAADRREVLGLGKQVLVKEEAAGNIKTLVVSTELGERDLYLDNITIVYTATADVGTRTLRVQLKEGATVLLTRTLNAGTNIVASQTETIILSEDRTYEEVDGVHFDWVPLGMLNLRGGLTLVVEDTADIEGTDTCKVYLPGKRV